MSASLNIGSRALATNLTALQVIGHNIANASTDGYSRQSVNLESAGYQMLGGNYFGKGVQLGEVERSYNAYLTREAQVTASMASFDTERLKRLQQLETLFPTGENGLGASINDMLNAWSDVSSSPSNLSARVVVLARAEELASRIARTASDIDALAYSGRQQAQATVDTVNQLAKDLARVNEQIAKNQGGTGQPNDLLDQRDELIDEISQHVKVSTIASDDGRMSVFVGGSQPLVLGSMAANLSVQRDPLDATQSQIAFEQGGTRYPLANDVIGGALGGLMSFLSEDLAAMQNQLGRMALTISTAVNEQHRLGVDLAGSPGGNVFVPTPNAMAKAEASNTGNARLQAQVADAAALLASDYRVSFTAGGVEITRLVDGSVTGFASLPAVHDGLRFELDTSGVAVTGDSFLLRPFAEAARSMQLALTSPAQLAAASPVAVTPNTGNSDGLSIEKLYASENSSSLSNPVTITFLSDGSFSATGLGPGNPAPDNPGPPASYNYKPGQAISLNGWNLTLRGSPESGDSFTIAPSASINAAQNSGNASALLDLRDFPAFDGVPMSDGYVNLLSKLGTTVQDAKFASNVSSQMANSSKTARAAVSGVNLDEEAARLLQFQQAYQASAKFLQVAQSAFDTLMASMG